MPPAAETMPTLDDTMRPPVVHGTADLTTCAYHGATYDNLIERIGYPASEAALLYDTGIACQLAFRREQGLDLQDRALERSHLYRVKRIATSGRPLRLLALAEPGDMMANTPLDFITNALDVRLDLLYVLPEQPLPPVIPDHDVAFFAAGDTDGPGLQRLRALFGAWPRPALNDPGFLPALARDALSRGLAGNPHIRSPVAEAVGRAELTAHPERFPFPCLIRPLASHAGAGLVRAATPADLLAYLRGSFDQAFFVTAYEDYAGPDGCYRKARIAFIDRKPFLCHMAISSHWMVHYLNAGMSESAPKREEEAQAMATFDSGFARRHAAAFEALHEHLGFDFYSIDCAETRDGRLLVFEADTAAIVHLMDPPGLFPYKQAAMRKVFDAFGDMLRRRAFARGT